MTVTLSPPLVQVQQSRCPDLPPVADATMSESADNDSRPPDMPAVYFSVRFRVHRAPRSWPHAFAIITAHATTGEHWPQARNRAADRRLRRHLSALAPGIVRITGYAPCSGHAEPGWAAPCSFEQGCDTGLAFLQDAIYFVEGDALYVSHCDARRRRVRVGAFRARLDVP